MILGAHVSTGGGIERSIANALDIGCSCFQIFTKNQRQWEAKPLSVTSISSFKELLEASGLGPVLSHDSYLINLASPKDDVFKRSIASLKDEIYRCSELGIDHLVMHPGSHMGEGVGPGLKRFIEGLDGSISILKDSNDHIPSILIENTAGQGTNLGSNLNQISTILDGSEFKSYLGLCLDTCHSFAAGYDIVSEKGYQKTMNEIDELIGLDRLKAVHLNDAMFEIGSRKDRHETIGEGRIGVDGFAHFINDPRLDELPGILETPGGPDSYRRELATLRSLLSS